MSLNTLTFYEVLGVDESATFDEIKKAYRKLALKYHTDRTQKNHNNNNNNVDGEDTTAIMAKINEAYETLGDEHLRKNYDEQQRMLHPDSHFFQPFSFSTAQNGSNSSPHTSNIRELDNLFHVFFNSVAAGAGGGSRSETGTTYQTGANASAAAAAAAAFFPHLPAHMNHVFMQKPAPILKNVTITFEQVYCGATVPVQIERWILDQNCKTTETETLYVTIPSGVDENEILVLKEKGNCLGEQKGDVKVFIKINNTTEFRRVGLDLYFDKSISLKEALCGFTFVFTFLDKKIYTMNNLTKHHVIPPEYKKCIPNMGLKRMSLGDQTSSIPPPQGNLVIVFHIAFPESLTATQVERLQEIL